MDIGRRRVGGVPQGRPVGGWANLLRLGRVPRLGRRLHGGWRRGLRLGGGRRKVRGRKVRGRGGAVGRCRAHPPALARGLVAALHAHQRLQHLVRELATREPIRHRITGRFAWYWPPDHWLRLRLRLRHRRRPCAHATPGMIPRRPRGRLPHGWHRRIRPAPLPARPPRGVAPRQSQWVGRAVDVRSVQVEGRHAMRPRRGGVSRRRRRRPPSSSTDSLPRPPPTTRDQIRHRCHRGDEGVLRLETRRLRP